MRRYAAVCLVLCLILGLPVACGPAGETPSPAGRTVEEVRWLMCTDGPFPADCSRYGFYQDLLREEAVRLTVAGADQAALTRILMDETTGDTTTLITLDYTDSNNRKLIRSPKLYPLSAYADELAMPHGPQAHPYAAYGIAGGPRGAAACEGVYVNRHYLEAVGAAAPHTLADLQQLCSAFLTHRTVQRELVASGRQAVPVVFGEEGRGLETLRHLFGIQADAPLRSPRLPALTDWMLALCERPSPTASLHASGEEFYTVLNKQAILYIGPAAAIDRYHCRYPDNPYLPVALSCDGYLAAADKYGPYITYLLRDGRPQTGVRVLNALLGADAQRTMAYGQENVHYILRDGAPQRIAWVSRALRENKLDFIAESGILAFPYLLQGVENPYDSASAASVRDITDERLAGQLDPVTAAGQAQILGEQLFRAYCEALLSGGIASAAEAEAWLQRHQPTA